MRLLPRRSVKLQFLLSYLLSGSHQHGAAADCYSTTRFERSERSAGLFVRFFFFQPRSCTMSSVHGCDSIGFPSVLASEPLQYPAIQVSLAQFFFWMHLPWSIDRLNNDAMVHKMRI